MGLSYRDTKTNQSQATKTSGFSGRIGMKLKEILKKYWILLLIVILAIGGLGTFFVIKNNKKGDPI